MSAADRGSSGNLEVQLPGRPLVRPWVEFLSRWSWEWFGTFTFKGEYIAPEAADKRWRVWVSQANRELYGPRWWKRGRGIRWVRALEMQRRGVLHYHALLGGVQDLNPLGWMDRWENLDTGMARIGRVESTAAVTAYVSKYVVKGGELDLGGPLRQLVPVPLRPLLKLQPPDASPAGDQVDPDHEDPKPPEVQWELPGLERQLELPIDLDRLRRIREVTSREEWDELTAWASGTGARRTAYPIIHHVRSRLGEGRPV